MNYDTQGENCALTIEGDGTVEVDSGYAGFASKGGTLNINGGTYELGETNNKGHLYSQNSSTIVINDGTYISTDAIPQSYTASMVSLRSTAVSFRIPQTHPQHC